jgi:hypothetical protein
MSSDFDINLAMPSPLPANVPVSKVGRESTGDALNMEAKKTVFQPIFLTRAFNTVSPTYFRCSFRCPCPFSGGPFLRGFCGIS